MKEDQDTILYLSGDSKDSIMRSPILAKYKKLGYEVLILDDPIDEFTTQHLSEYEKRKVKSISKEDVSVLGTDEIAKKIIDMLINAFKKRENREPTNEEVGELMDELSEERIAVLLNGGEEFGEANKEEDGERQELLVSGCT